jgi:hypothetical protein
VVPALVAVLVPALRRAHSPRCPEVALSLAILRRIERNGRIYRVIDCPKQHEVFEPAGARAPFAREVKACGVCNLGKVNGADTPVIGTCGAMTWPLSESRARPCGRPARHLKRGEPRCGFHFRKGAQI